MTTDSGSFTGYASIFGALDRQGEIVDKGAFSRSLPTFRKAGLISWAHNLERPVATIAEAREDDIGLFIRGAWHSTADGQMARTIVTERLAAKASVGLSIGYQLVKARPDGRAMHLLDLELLEVGIVMVPALPLAGVLAAKGAKVGDPVPLKTLDGRRLIYGFAPDGIPIYVTGPTSGAPPRSQVVGFGPLGPIRLRR